jgi:flagellar assembly protein FliH
MMTSSPERVLRGAPAAAAPTAPLDGVLTERRGGVELGADLRLLDPDLGRAMDALAMTVRQNAIAEGYAVGWAQGRRAAAEQAELDAAGAAQDRREAAERADAALAGALRALAAAADDLERRTAPVVADVTDAVLHAAVALAETLLGRELTLTATPARDAVHRALAVAPVDRPVTVHLHRDDVAPVAAALAQNPMAREVHLVADPDVAVHGAVVACDATLIDAQLESALERVRQVLAG